MGHDRGHNPAAWGFGVAMGVLLAVVAVIAVLVIGMFILCGGGCAAIMAPAIYEAQQRALEREQERAEAEYESPAVEVVEPRKPLASRTPKFELLGKDETGSVPIFKLRIWEDIPTDRSIEIALERLQANEKRRVYIYSIDQPAEGEPFAIWDVSSGGGSVKVR